MSQAVARRSSRAERVRFVVFVVTGGLFALMVAVMLLPNTAAELVSDWGGPHAVHDLMFTLFAVMVLAGLAAQIGAPRRRVAAMSLVIGFPLGLGVAGAATGFVFPPLMVMLALAAVATITHPASGELVRPRARPHAATLALAAAWLVPAVLYAADHLALQAGAVAGDEHAEVGHWVGAAVIVLLVPAFATVAGLRSRGWAVPAGVTAVVAVVLGSGSIGFPSHVSSFGVGWGVAAIVWGLALAATSLYSARQPSGAAGRGSGDTTTREVRR